MGSSPNIYCGFKIITAVVFILELLLNKVLCSVHEKPSYNHLFPIEIQPIYNVTLNYLKPNQTEPLVLKSRQNQAFQPKFPKDQNPEIDLNKVLEAISGSGKPCFIVADDYVGTIIFPQIYPLILRRSIPAIMTKQNNPGAGYPFPDFHWLPYKYANPRNETFTNAYATSDSPEGLMYCPNSTYKLSLLEIVNDQCVSVNLFEYSSKSRPWNCEITVDLFVPSIYVEPPLSLPRPFSYVTDLDRFTQKLFAQVLPSLCKLHILIESEVTLTRSNNTLLQNWLRSYFLSFAEISGPIVRTQKYYLVSVPFDSRNLLLSSPVGYKISDVTPVLRITCVKSTCNLVEDVEISNFGNPNTENQNLQIWRITNPWPPSTTQFSSKYIKHFLMCKNYLWPFSRVSTILQLPFTSTTDKFAHGIVSLWLTAMQNISISNHRIGALCINGKREKIRYKSYILSRFIELRLEDTARNDLVIPPFTVSAATNELRFLSCGGENRKKGLAFAEFYNVYQAKVWVAILIFSMVLANLNRLLAASSKKVSLSEHLFMVVKSLLEQGDPFNKVLLLMKSPRYMVACYLLAAIVISNAYKNSNVYNMIAPRAIVPYERISELLRDNFSIYSKITFVHISFKSFEHPGKRNQRLNYSVNFSPHFDNKNPKQVLWDTIGVGLITIDSQLQRLRALVQVDHSYESAAFKDAYLKTSLHPLLPKYLTTMSHILTKNSNQLLDTQVGKNEMMTHIVNAIYNTEKSLILQALKDCKKVAVMLPASQCNKYARTIKTFQNHNQIFVGREKYVNVTTTFRILGVAHQSLLKRLKIIAESGIFNWWVNFFAGDRSFVKFADREFHIQKPSLKGNAQLIFYLIICGLVIAIVVFAAECCFKIFIQISK